MRPLVLSLAGCADDREPREPGNVVIVVMDEVGIDRLGLSGLPAPTPPTPALDRLAADGVRFANAWAYSTCSPSRAALLTGRHAHRSGIGEVVLPDAVLEDLPDDEVTLAELVGEAGWDTSLVGKWHLTSFDVPDVAEAPLRHGFGKYQGTLGNLYDAVGSCDHRLGYWRWEEDLDGAVSLVETYATTATTDAAIARASEMRAPWLLVVAYNAAHAPVHMPPEELTAEAAAGIRLDPVDAMMVALDHELGRLVDALPEDTTILVTSDNGTPKSMIRPPLSGRQGKGSSYELGLRVPLIVRGPVVGEPGATSDALVSIVDVLPTVAALAGIDPGDDRDGASLVPLLEDPSGPWSREVAFAERFSPNGLGPHAHTSYAARDRSYKLVVDDGHEALYLLDETGLERGPDLLSAGDPLDAAAQTAVDRLRDEIARQSR